MQANVTMFSGTGTGSADASVVPLNPVSSGPGAETSTARLDVTITSTATIVVEGTVDGSTWRTIQTVSAAGQYEYDTSCFAAVRAYPSANGSGVVIKGTLVKGSAAGAAGAGGGVIGQVGADSFYASNDVTRPADGGAAVAAGDVLANSTSAPVLGSITVAARVGQTIRIDDIRLSNDDITPTVQPQVRIHLYTVPRASLATATAADNAPYLDYFNNGPYYRGYIDIPTLATKGGASTASRSLAFNPAKFFQCDPADTKLYYLMETNTAFTPSAQSKTWRLSIGGVRY